MDNVAAFAGLVATVALIACAVLAYHAWYIQRQLDDLKQCMREVGERTGVRTELPYPARPSLDEYAPDAIIDDESVNREWQLPRSLRHWSDES